MKNYHNLSSMLAENLGFNIVNEKKTEIDVNEAFKSALLRSLSSSGIVSNQVYIDMLNTSGYALSELKDSDFIEVELSDTAIAKAWNYSRNFVIIDQNGEIIVAVDDKNGFLINKPDRKSVAAMINGLHKWTKCRVYYFNKRQAFTKSKNVKFEPFNEKVFFADAAGLRTTQAAVLKLIKMIDGCLDGDSLEQLLNSDKLDKISDVLQKSNVFAWPDKADYRLTLETGIKDEHSYDRVTLKFASGNWSNQTAWIYDHRDKENTKLSARIASAILYNVRGCTIDNVSFKTYVDVLNFFKKDAAIRKYINITPPTTKVTTMGDSGLKDSYTNVADLVDTLNSELFNSYFSRLTGNILLGFNEKKKDTVYVFASDKSYPSISALKFAKNTFAVKGSLSFIGPETWSGINKYDLTAIPPNLVNSSLYLISLSLTNGGKKSITTMQFNEFYSKYTDKDYGDVEVLVNSNYEKQRGEAIQYVIDKVLGLEKELQTKFPEAAIKRIGRDDKWNGYEQALRNILDNFGIEGWKELNKR